MNRTLAITPSSVISPNATSFVPSIVFPMEPATTDIGRIKEEVREVNLNGDDKRFWLGRLENINDGKKNDSMSLNPEFFAERFELNDDYPV